MTVYNGEAYLVEALNSLLGQTFRDFELIAVDDGSTDRSRSILYDFAARDPRVVVVENERNAGTPASLNRGLERCRAAIVARADADDVYEPGRLEQQVRFLELHPEVGLLGTAYHRIDAEGQRLGTVYPPAEDRVIRFRQLFMNSFLHPAVAFRTHLVRQVRGYDEEYWTAQDSDLWVRLRPHTRMANLPQPLVSYRVHNASTVRTRGSQGIALSLSVPHRLLCEYLQRPVDLEEARAIVALFQGFERLEPEQVPIGILGLEEVLRRASRIEHLDTVRYYKQETGRSLLRQSVYQAGTGHPVGRTLLHQALRWYPPVAFSRDAAKPAVRFLLPPAAQKVVRFWTRS